MLIGGEQVNDGEDFLEKNLPLFIPVSLAGRVHTKVIGPVNTGDCIVLSHIPGVGRAAKPRANMLTRAKWLVMRSRVTI